jgi:hypothetical protein
VAKLRGAAGVVERTVVVERSAHGLKFTDGGSTWFARMESLTDQRIRLESDRGYVVLERMR